MWSGYHKFDDIEWIILNESFRMVQGSYQMDHIESIISNESYIIDHTECIFDKELY